MQQLIMRACMVAATLAAAAAGCTPIPMPTDAGPVRPRDFGPDSFTFVDGAGVVLPASDVDAAVAVDEAVPADLAAPLGPATFLLTLDAGAFPPSSAHPSALVYVPSGFDPTPPLNVVVYLHGWSNCVENVVRDAGASCDPNAGTPARQAYALAAQLETSNKNALLLCPEVEFDAQSSNPGNLGTSGGFAALLGEVLGDLQSTLGAVGLADVGRLVVASHSGGYEAAAGLAERGGVAVHELYLLDSLYGNFSDFDAWVQSDLASFVGAAPGRRFADVYTCCGGTLANSQAMATRAAGWVGASTIVDDRTTSTWPPATYHHGLLFKESGLAHDGVPRYYFGQLLATSGLPDKH
jgi:hypothetical protein